MARRHLDELRAERMQRLEQKLERARATLAQNRAAIDAQGPAPVAGDILLAPGDAPELLVIAPREGRDWLVVPINGADADSETIHLDDELCGPISISVKSIFRAKQDALEAMKRTGIVSAELLMRVQSLIAAPRDEPVLIPTRSRARIAMGALTALAASILLTLFFYRGGVRENAGLYRLRSKDGEVGAELRVSGRVCRARGVLDSSPCRRDTREPVVLEYRLDDGMAHRYVLAFSEGGPGRQLLYPADDDAALLEPTVIDGGERCARGFCSLAAIRDASSSLWVVFFDQPTRLRDLPTSDPAGWVGVVPYRFDLAP